MANKNLFLQSPTAGDIEEIFSQGADALTSAPVAAQGLPPQPSARTATPAPVQAPTPSRAAPTVADLERRAAELDIDPALARSFFTQESGSNWNSRDSSKGARGGMQVMPDTYKAMMGSYSGQRDPWNNMEAGLRYIAYGQKTLGTKDPALLAAGYHAGYDRKDLKAGKIPQGIGDGHISTSDYAASVARRVGLGSGDLQAKLNKEEPGRYKVLTPAEAQDIERRQLQGTLDAEEPGRFKVLTDDELAKLPASASIPPGVDDGTPKEVGFWGRLPQVAQNGWQNMTGALDVSRAVLSDDFTPSTINTISTNLENQIRRSVADAGRQHSSERELKQAIEDFGKTKGWGDTTKGVFSLLGTAAMNPKGVAIGTVEQIANMLPSVGGALGGAATGAGVGAAAGSVIPGAGTAAGAATGALWGSRAGLMAGTATLEFGNEITEAITSRLAAKNLQPTRENIAALLSDPAVQSEVKTQAAKKGLTLAAVDALSMGLAGKVGSKGVQAAASGSKGKAAAYGAGAFGVELAGEPAGEAASQLVARGEIDKADVAAEGIYGAGSAVGGAAMGTAGQVVRDRVAGKSAPAPAAAPAAAPAGQRQEPTIDVTYTDGQGNTVTETVPGAATATPAAAPTGPIGRALEKASPAPAAQPAPEAAAPAAPAQAEPVDMPRVRITAENGQTMTGFSERLGPDGSGRVIGDDGQVYQFTPADGVTIEQIEQPAAPDAQEAAAPAAPAPAAPETATETEAATADAAKAEPEKQEEAKAPATAEPEATAAPAPATTEAPAQEAARPLTEWSEQELRDRMRYVTQQAKANGGWDGRLTKERGRISREINRRNAEERRNTEAKNDQKPAANAVPDAPVAPASDQAAAPVPGDQPARSSVAEKPDVRADAGQASAREPELPVRTDVPGADAAANNQPALKDPHAGKWFGSSEKADAYLTRKKAGATHEVVKTGKVRWEIKPKAQAEAQVATVSDPVAKSQRAIVFQNTRSRLTSAYNGEEYRGKKEDYATLRADLEQVAADTSNPNSAQAKEVLDAVDQAIQNLEANKRYKAEQNGAPVVREDQTTEQAAPVAEADNGRRYHVEVVNDKTGKVEQLSTGEPMTQAQAIRFRDKFTKHENTRFRLRDVTAETVSAPATADADLDAMFDEAVAAKKQADAQAAPKTITEKLKESIARQGEEAAANNVAKKLSASDVMKKIDAHNDAWRELYARHGGWIKERGVVRVDAPKEVKAAVKAHKSKSAQLRAEYDAAIAEGELAREAKVKQADPVQDAATQAGQELTQKKEKRAPYISKEDAQHLFGSKKPSKAAQAKEKIAQVSAKHLGGAVAGDTITASQDFDYVTGGKPMVIESISPKGEVHVHDPVSGGRTSFNASMASARRVEFTVTQRAEAPAKKAKPAKTEAAKAAESLTSAAKNTAAGLTAAIDGLGELFGGAGKFNSGLAFDEETYAKAKPLFKQAISHLGDAGSDLRQAMQAIVNMVMDKFGADVTQRMKPYVVRFVADVRDGKESETNLAQAQDTQAQAAIEEVAPLDAKARVQSLRAQVPAPKKGQPGIVMEPAVASGGADAIRFHVVDAQGEKIGKTQMVRAATPDAELVPLMQRLLDDTLAQDSKFNKPKAAPSDVVRGKGESNAASATRGMERRGGQPATEPVLADGDGDATGAVRQRDGDGGRAGRGQDQGQQSDPGVSPYRAPAHGDGSFVGVHRGDGAAEFAAVAAGSEFRERGSGIGDAGVPAEPYAAEATRAAADSPAKQRNRQRAQRAADGVKSAPGIDNIRATLPSLLAAQQDDVAKTEARFAKPDGYGMLLTNGTGTGKTYSGLGVAKRFYRDGKRNILIVVPDEKVGSDWVDSAGDLLMDASTLADTKTAGDGVVVATYANLGQNNALASRAWDLVIADEAHKLMQGSKGEATAALDNLRAITMHPDGAYTRYQMQNAGDIAALQSLIAQQKENQKPDDALAAKIDALDAKLTEARKKVQAEVAASQGEKRPRAMFLSATPFAYEKAVDWAQGYLFEYPKAEGTGYNSGDGQQRFMMQHFGYTMRYNKLTEPDSKVDRGLMQRNFNTWLKREGALSGRVLDVDADYDRRFVLIDSNVGNRIDEAFSWLDGQRREATGEDGRVWQAMSQSLNDAFDYLSRRYLLEAIKAKESIPYVKGQLERGRKVVVFHDYKKGGGFNPFAAFARMDAPANLSSSEAAKFRVGLDRFRSEFGDLVAADWDSLGSAVGTYSEAFGNKLLVVNGDQKPRDNLARYKRFQDDASGPQVILVQSAKNAGWSGHDTTGKHQRVLLNLGLPTAPIMAIQQEGRIYRTGQASDAIMRYMNTGTSWEKTAFAATIAGRASTAENLGMGEDARALKDSFIAAFEESDAYPPGHEGEGTGGKERDRAANAALTEYDRAKAYYWATQKKNSKTKAQEGKDYFATPEPLGQKMVEWTDPRGGDKALEPSAGHGAIARWFGENVERTVVEPSTELRARLSLVIDPANDRMVAANFEDLAQSNKYDVIAMNPPFGTAGRTAIDHLAKATQHLRDRGRVVAIIPTGPAADKKFDAWLYEQSDKGQSVHSDLHLVADIKLPQSAFERAGTSVAARVVVIDKVADADAAPRQTRNIDLSDAQDITAFFDRLEDITIPQRAVVEQAQEADGPTRAEAPNRGSATTERQEGDVPTEHTTGKGKTLRGVVRHGVTQEQAKAIDPYTFKKDSGWFIREKYLAEAAPKYSIAPGIDRAQEVPVASIQSFDVSPDELYAKANEWFRENLTGVSVRNESLGAEIHFSKAGRGKVTSVGRRDPRRMSVVQALPELVKNGVLIEEDGDRKGRDGLEGYATLLAPVQVDGKTYAVPMKVRRATGRDIFYTVEAFNLENSSGGGVGPLTPTGDAHSTVALRFDGDATAVNKPGAAEAPSSDKQGGNQQGEYDTKPQDHPSTGYLPDVDSADVRSVSRPGDSAAQRQSITVGELLDAINEANRAFSLTASPAVDGIVMSNSENGNAISANDLKQSLTSGQFGSVFSQLLGRGSVVLHDTASSVPGENHPVGMQAVTMPDGKIHLVGQNLTPATAPGVLLHEAFHVGVENLLGTEAWNGLLGRVGVLRKQAQQSSGKTNAVLRDAMRSLGYAQRVAAERGAPMGQSISNEEFGAYIIEHYEQVPATFRKWADDVIGAVKAWLLRRFGWQAGQLTPAQLRALAVAALRDGIGQNGGQRYSIKRGQNSQSEPSYAERIGSIIKDIGFLAQFTSSPRQNASIHPKFTPVFLTQESQTKARNAHVAELGKGMTAYNELTADQKVNVNKVLELGRLMSETYDAEALSEGVVNTGNKKTVRIAANGKPRVISTPIHAALTGPGEVVQLSPAEIKAYLDLRGMFDQAMDKFRDQTLVEFGFPELAGEAQSTRPLDIVDNKDGTFTLMGKTGGMMVTVGEGDGAQEKSAARWIHRLGGELNEDTGGFVFPDSKRAEVEQTFEKELKKSVARRIEDLIDENTPASQVERIKNIASFIREIEQAKRTGYVPFTRYGDYYVTVKEKVADLVFAKDGDDAYVVTGVTPEMVEGVMDLGGLPEGDGYVIPAKARAEVAKLAEKTVYSAKVETEIGDMLAIRRVQKAGTEGRKDGSEKIENIPSVGAAIEKARKEWLDGHPERRLIANPIIDIQSQKQVGMSDIDVLAHAAGLNNANWDAMRDELENALRARSFRKHFFNSDNVPGYSADFERSMADYVVGMSGYLSRRAHAAQWDKVVADIDRQPRLRAEAERYRDYTQNPVEEFAAMRQIGFASYIAGVAASAFANLTQVPIATVSTLTQIAPRALVLKEIARAYKDTFAMVTHKAGLDVMDLNKAPKDVRQAVLLAQAEGAFVPLETFDMMMTARQRNVGRRKLVKGINDAVNVLAVLFSFAERVNRLTTFIAAARLAEKPAVRQNVAARLAKGNALVQQTLTGEGWSPERFAAWAVDETQFVLGKGNRNRLSRGVGAPIMQFKSFTIGMLELLYRQATMHGKEGKMAFATSLLAMYLFAGVWGIPGADDLRKLIELLYKKTMDRDLDLKTELRAFIAKSSVTQFIADQVQGAAGIDERKTRNAIAQAVTKGVSYPAGVDLTRVGMGNIFPTGEATALDLLGIPADLLIKRPLRAFEKASAGDAGGAVGAMLPNFAKHWAEAAGWSVDGVRDKSGQRILSPDQLSTNDILMKSLGFQPSIVTDVRDYEYAQRRQETAVDGLKRKWTSEIARTYVAIERAEDAGDAKKVAALVGELDAVYAKLEEHNAKASPEEIIQIGSSAIRNRMARERGGVMETWGKERKQAREGAEGLRDLFGLSKE